MQCEVTDGGAYLSKQTELYNANQDHAASATGHFVLEIVSASGDQQTQACEIITESTQPPVSLIHAFVARNSSEEFHGG